MTTRLATIDAVSGLAYSSANVLYCMQPGTHAGVEAMRQTGRPRDVLRRPADVYRKVMPRKDAEFEAEMEGQGE